MSDPDIEIQERWMSPEWTTLNDLLQAARDSLVAWEAKKTERGIQLRAAPTPERAGAWLEARNRVVEIRREIERLEGAGSEHGIAL